MYGAICASGSSARRAAAIASTSAPSNGVSTGRQVRHPLARDVRAEQLVDLAQERLLAARQDPAVDHRLGRRRDDVRLVAGLEHRRVGRVAHGRARRSGRAGRACAARPRRRPRAPPARSISPSRSRNCRTVSVMTSGNGVLAEPRDGGGELGDGVVVVQERAVPGHAARAQPHPAQALLRGLDEVDPLLVQREREAADLADRLGAALEEVGPVLHQPLRAERAARLLVRDEGEDDVARRHDAVAARSGGRPRSSSRPCPSCRPRRGPRRSRPAPHRRTGAPTTPTARPAPRRGARARAARRDSGSAPRSRQKTLSRPGAPESSTSTSYADLGELPGDVLRRLPLADRASPARPCWWCRSRSAARPASTTSSSAALVMGIFLPPRRELLRRPLSWRYTHGRAAVLVRVAEWQTR